MALLWHEENTRPREKECLKAEHSQNTCRLHKRIQPNNNNSISHSFLLGTIGKCFVLRAGWWWFDDWWWFLSFFLNSSKRFGELALYEFSSSCSLDGKFILVRLYYMSFETEFESMNYTMNYHFIFYYLSAYVLAFWKAWTRFVKSWDSGSLWEL